MSANSAAEKSGHSINASNTTSIPLSEDFYAASGQPYYASYEFWWLTLWSCVGVSWSSVVVTILPLWMLSGNTFVRWQSGACLVGTVFFMNTAVQTLLPVIEFGGVVIPSTLRTMISFLSQIVPMALAPWMLRGQLRGSMRSPCHMHSIIVLVELVVAVIIAGVIAPAFSRATPVVQVGIRLIAFPIIVEVLVMVSRCSGIRYLKPHLPQDMMLGYIWQAVTITAVVGRFLTTNMNTTAQTVLVSVATATIEVIMRLTMVHRDGFYQRLCSSRTAHYLGRCQRRVFCSSAPDEQIRSLESVSNGDDSDLFGADRTPSAIPLQPLQRRGACPISGTVKPQAVPDGSLIDDSASSYTRTAASKDDCTEQTTVQQRCSSKVPTKSEDLAAETPAAFAPIIDTSGVRQPSPGSTLESLILDPRSTMNSTASPSLASRGSALPQAGTPAHRQENEQGVLAAEAPSASFEQQSARGQDEDSPPQQSLMPTAAISIHVPQEATVHAGPVLLPKLSHSDPPGTAEHHDRMRRVGNNAVNTQSYYAFLIADTMGEDIGILASLSLSLLFRVPARRGELPIAPEQVVIRVAIQYLLEALTDIGPALTYYAISMLCGVRLHPVTSRMVAESVGVPAVHAQRTRKLHRTGGHQPRSQSNKKQLHVFDDIDGVPTDFQTPAVTPGVHELVAIAEVTELDSGGEDNLVWSVRSGDNRRVASGESQSPVSSSSDEGARVGDDGLQLEAQLQDMDTGSMQGDSAREQAKHASQPDVKASIGPIAAHRSDNSLQNVGSSSELAGGGCASIFLRQDDTDVVAASAQAHDRFALRRLDIASDPIWQPVEMKRLLQLAVFGSTAHAQLAGSDASGRSLSQISDASELDAVAAPPRRVLFREVRAASLAQLSTAQYVAAWLALRTELLAVRLSRAWETRVPGWTLVYIFSTLHALNLITRILTGVALRCPYVDPDGEWYWNFCSE